MPVSNEIKQKLPEKTKIYNMQYLSEFTAVEGYWLDNFHLNDSGMRIVENTILGQDNRYIKIEQ